MSQALSFVMVLVSAAVLIYQLRVKKADGSTLYLSRQTPAPDEGAKDGE